MAFSDVALAVPGYDFSEMNSAGGKRAKQAGYYLYYPPLGLCSIAASLSARGFSVEIFDGQVDTGSDEELADLIASRRPRLAGVSVTTPALGEARKLISALRKRLDAPIVVGGPHVSCDPGILRALGADYGIVGDGEEAFSALADALLRGGRVPGPESGVVAPGDAAAPTPAMADLESIPLPSRSLLRNPGAYFNPFINTRTTTLLSARGCPFQCSFCCRTLSMGAHRPASVERAMAEIELAAREGYGFVSVIDETFTFNRERAIEIARGIKRLGAGLKWSCQTRADLLDEESAIEFRRAGCVNVSFGVEFGDERARLAADKPVSDAALDRAFAACRAAGLTINAFLMIGGPDESREDIERTIECAIKLSPDFAVFNIGSLFPGAREYERRLAAGEIDRSVWDDMATGARDMPLLSRRLERPELAELLRRGYSKFYLRPGYIIKKAFSIRSAREAYSLLKQARTVVADYVAK